jgi:hypothetical protein
MRLACLRWSHGRRAPARQPPSTNSPRLEGVGAPPPGKIRRAGWCIRGRPGGKLACR